MNEYSKLKKHFLNKITLDLQRLGRPPGFSQIERTFLRVLLSPGQSLVFVSCHRFRSECLGAAEVGHHCPKEEQQLIFDGGP